MSFERRVTRGTVWILLAVVAAAGCGSGTDTGSAGASGSKGPDAAPPRPGGGEAAIMAEFFTNMGDNAMNVTIHLAVLDANGNTVYTADAVTGEFGIATFKGLPVGEYTLRFSDDRRNRCEFKVNLRDFTGDRSGASVGSCTF